MKYMSALLAATAVSALAAQAAHADAGTPVKHHKVRHHHAAASAPAPKADDSLLTQEVSQLRAEVNALNGQVAADRQALAAQQTQTQAALGAAKAVAANQANVKAEIASAFDTEHKKGYAEFKGIRLTPGGFLELAGVYRQHFQGADIATPFAIPFGNTHNAYVNEGRFSARQSRVSLLAQGNANKNTVLSMYGELDFLGAAQTANANESNSFNPRVRHLYASADWQGEGLGVQFLAGQTFSLATMNDKGITPRNEKMPPQIDAQYIPGFVWVRQPQVRLTVNSPDKHWWAAVSAESPATTNVGTVPGSISINLAAPGGSLYNAANSISYNNTPDFAGKLAYEGAIAGHALHLEGFALSRTFTDRVNGVGNNNKAGYGFGGGVIYQVVPQKLDVQFSGMSGKGLGRYGTSQLSDVTFGADGSIHAIHEFMMLGGVTLHATKKTDLYVFAGKEQQDGLDLGSGYGNAPANANNAGCFTEGGTCNGNTRRVQQITGGAWQKIYSGAFGRAMVGLQYSYTERQLFADANGNAPSAHQNIGLVSFRYYPF